MTSPRAALVDPLLSVVMPAYNERDTVAEIIERVLAVPLRLELIVVDDCSTDGTYELLQELQQSHRFTLVQQPTNRGKGAALRRGFQEVTGDLVVSQDADLEYAPEELPGLIDLICQGPCGCGLRIAVPGDGPGVLAHALCWEPVAHLGDEPLVQHAAHRHGNLLQDDAHRGDQVHDVAI